METQGGMVAVVRGLQDSSLTVTLLDGGKQYTLMPNDYVPQPRPVPRCPPSVHSASQYINDECSGSTAARHRENGIQATDGRFASTYKMMHCNLTPTSPPQTVSEFPPQRSEVIHGHGNFVIGGSGSGETAPPAIKSTSFRGGMVWPDKGSVCASRASIKSDAFANSLRKYPNITPDRSSEIVQRLISFTQAKNISKNQNRCPCSPTRNSMDFESSKHTFILERNASRNSMIANTIYQADDNVATKRNRLGGSPPLRKRSNNFSIEGTNDSWSRSMFCKDNDVRCCRDTARKLKEFKNQVPTSPHNKSPVRVMEHDCQFYQRRMRQESKRSVNMEIQAGAQMETKEMLTLPRIVPMQRTVATPLSPIPSKTEERIEKDIKCAPLPECSCKSVQVKLKIDDHIKTSSTFDLHNNTNEHKNKRSRSAEELVNSKSKPDHVLMQECNNNSDINELFSKCPMSKKKRICQNCKHLFDDFDIVRRSVSNNTYFREEFNINQQRTSKHFVEMSKHYYINGSKRVSRERNNRMQQQLQIQDDYLSHIVSRDNNRLNEAGKEHRFTKTSSDSSNGTCGCDNTDLLIKYVDGERNDVDYGQIFDKEINKSSKNLALTQEEIRNLIDLDILAFAEKYRLNITTEMLYDLNEELFDLFVTDLNNNSFPNKKNMTEKIKYILKNRGLPELQTIYLTNILTEHWEEEFLTINNLKLKSSNFQSTTLVVLPNILQNSSEYKQDEKNAIDDNEISIKAITQKDIDTNVKVYVNQISNEINEWLSNLLMPEVQDKVIRSAIINDLAADVVDRHKYLELNPSSESSDTSELEHLKYQIFKLIYKLGINDMTLVDRAIDLMKRFQNIAVPVFSIQEGQERKSNVIKLFSPKVENGQSIQTKVSEPSNLGASSSKYVTSSKVCCNRPTCRRNLNKKGISTTFSGKSISLREPARSYQPTANSSRMSTGKIASTNRDYNAVGQIPQPEADEVNLPSKQYQNTTSNVPLNRSALFSGGIKIRDDDNDIITSHSNTQNKTSEVDEIDKAYKRYLKEWVEKIPLPMVTAEDQMVAEIARTDIYNGILDAVSKLRSERDTFDNRFLFEDKLDDEIEKILSQLPQSPELGLKKHILKVKLIEEISNINDFMKSSTKSYKQQLLENLKGNLPKLTLNEVENPDILEIYEELQILNLVEDFIICCHYQNQDPYAAEAYRKKLLKRTEEFIQDLKANHNKALKNIDTKIYLDDILNLLKNVPLPSNETIQEEADEIILSIEIDKWFSALPLVQNNDYVEQLQRRRLRNYLAKQIIAIEKGNLGVGNPDSVLNDSLKHEISQFLQKAPLQHGESVNINYMVDELIKKLKNRQAINGNDSKKVAFNEPDYEEFSRNLPLSSTYTEQPYTKIETKMKGISGTKSIQALDPSQQSHSGYYHNISKPLLDDLRIDQISCNDVSLGEIPNYETFDDAQPKSSSLKDDVDPNWFTLQESRQGYQQSKKSFDNNINQNRTEQSNKSIQTDSPSEQSQSRHYHNIAQPLLDDLRQDSNCCNDDLVNNDLLNGVRPRDGRSEPNWYSLHECKQNCSQFLNEPFVPDNNTSQRLGGQEQIKRVEHYNMPEEDFNIPQHVDPNHYEVQQERDTSFNSLRSKRRNDSETSIPSKDENVRRHFSNTAQHRWSNSHSPTGSSPRRRHSPRFNQRYPSPRLDQAASPQPTPYLPRSPKEPNRNMSNRLGHENIIEDQRNGSPQQNRSDVFYRTTDPDGIRRIIDRNKSREAEVAKSNPSEHIPEYCQPSVLIPPCYVPLRLGTKKGHMTDRNIDVRYREEDSDEENDEEDEVRCRCAEKLWKSKRRVRYCPFEQYEGYPMCVTSPYFYPYYY